jgi:hypothetical protein
MEGAWLQTLLAGIRVLFRILSSHWLSHLYWLKKSAEVLLYFGLDCGLLTSRNPKNNVDSPAFLEHGMAEKMADCAHTTRPNKEDD